VVIASLVIAACQSMYGPKPEKLRTPGKLPVPVQTEQALAGPAYVEDCAVDFQKAPPKAGVKRDERSAAKLVETGDATLSSADTTTDGTKRGDLMRASIERYSDALARDPFNADVTPQARPRLRSRLPQGLRARLAPPASSRSPETGTSSRPPRRTTIGSTTTSSGSRAIAPRRSRRSATDQRTPLPR
jgi:hypothetical protein